MQAGSIKQAGRIFTRIQINKQDLIRASRVENGNFFYRDGSKQGKIFRILINKQEQAGLREHTRVIGTPENAATAISL